MAIGRTIWGPKVPPLKRHHFLCIVFLVSCTCFNKYLFLLLHGWIPSGQTCIHQIQQKNPLQNHILQLVVMSLELSSGTVPQSLTFMILKPWRLQASCFVCRCSLKFNSSAVYSWLDSGYVSDRNIWQEYHRNDAVFSLHPGRCYKIWFYLIFDNVHFDYLIKVVFCGKVRWNLVNILFLIWTSTYLFFLYHSGFRISYFKTVISRWFSPNHMSPLKGASFLWLIKEVEGRDLKHNLTSL